MSVRVDAVLTVIYLIFNEGYATTRGSELVRTDLCAEAIRLAGLIRELMMPNPPAEAAGLLALMLFHDSRKDSRLDEAGDIVLLAEQDRSLWDHEQIAEAMPLVDEAFWTDPGPSLCKLLSQRCTATQKPRNKQIGRRIVQLYSLLERLQPSPVIALNRAAAVAMADGPDAGLGLMDELATSGVLNDYHLFHAARADLLRRAARSRRHRKVMRVLYLWSGTIANGVTSRGVYARSHRTRRDRCCLRILSWWPWGYQRFNESSKCTPSFFFWQSGQNARKVGSRWTALWS